jgi:hypothetical protein
MPGDLMHYRLFKALFLKAPAFRFAISRPFLQSHILRTACATKCAWSSLTLSLARVSQLSFVTGRMNRDMLA